MTNTFGLDQVRSGQLIDGDPSTSYQSCVIAREPGKSAIVSVPFVSGVQQFAAADRWFTKQSAPKSLIYHDQEGAAAITGLRWAGTSGFSYSLGKLSVGQVVFGHPRELRDEYRFVAVMSNIDGLAEFARFSPITSNFDISRSPLTVTVDPAETVSWRHGGFTHRIRANAPWRFNTEGDFTANSEAFIETTKSRRATADDHITAQWPLRALLVLAHGEQLHWRGHHIKDQQFPTWMLDGSAREPTSIEMQSRRTIRDLDQPPADRAKLRSPMFHLADLGSRGLRRWYGLYEHEAFRRAIEPAVEVINGASRFLEPRIMMTTLGLDAMGYFLDPERKKNTALHKQILRCITAARNDWSSIGPDVGIARAIANINNDLKHPDRPSRPDSLSLQLIDGLATALMRLQVFELLDLPEKLRKFASGSNGLRRAVENFHLNGVTINENGTIIHA